MISRELTEKALLLAQQFPAVAILGHASLAKQLWLKEHFLLISIFL